MKPLDFTKPITTRDGRAVRILCTDAQCYYANGFTKTHHPIVGVIDGFCLPQTWHASGKFKENETSFDLINPPAEIEIKRWVNVYSGNFVGKWDFDTKEEANKNAMVGRIACVEITIKCKEGDGLNP